MPDDHLEVVVDSRERYGYTFADGPVTTTRARLDEGHYGLVRHGRLLASVERKSLADLVSSLTSGKLGYQLAELAALPRAAVVVEDRYSAVFKLDRVRPASSPTDLPSARCGGLPCPSSSVTRASSRRSGLTASWQPRRSPHRTNAPLSFVADLAHPPQLAPAPPSPAEVRAWALTRGYDVSSRGRLPSRAVAAYLEERDG